MNTHHQIPRAGSARFTILALAASLVGLLGCSPRDSAPPAQSAQTQPAAPRLVLVPLTNMVPIKAGSFVRIRQPVTLTRDYWLGKHEVTQAEYARVMAANPSHFQGNSNSPVEKVTFFEAQAYCSALTALERQAGHLPPEFEYRLPSEAEWEFACRAGTTNRFSFGDDAAAADAFAWTLENGESQTHPVGQKQPNAWGLHDMHGNVWEWCLDWFAPYPEQPATDPQGPPEGKFKVFRGGGWNQEVQYARSGNRFMMSPSNGIHFVGFRLALAPTASAPRR